MYHLGSFESPVLTLSSPSKCSERKLSRSAKAIGRIRWMVFLDKVKSTRPVMLTKSFPPTSVMKLSASRSSTVRRSTCGGTKRRPLSAQSVLSDSERFRHTQWKGQAETTPHVSPAPIKDGSRQHVTRVSQWNAGKGTESGSVLFVALGQGQWIRWDDKCKDEARRDRERMDRGETEGKVKCSALCLWWRCVWGRCFCLQGLRDGGTGMVDRLAIHRPAKREHREHISFGLITCSDVVLGEMSEVCFCVCCPVFHLLTRQNRLSLLFCTHIVVWATASSYVSSTLHYCPLHIIRAMQRTRWHSCSLYTLAASLKNTLANQHAAPRYYTTSPSNTIPEDWTQAVPIVTVT